MFKTYKWEKLKKDAISQFLTGSDRYAGTGREMAIAAIIESNLVDKNNYNKPDIGWEIIYGQLREDIVKVIDAWDVRCATKLIEKFPNIVRKQDVDKKPTVEMNDNCEWVVVFNQR